MEDFTPEKMDLLFKEFYLNRKTISYLCDKHGISRYLFYKLKKLHPKKSFYHYSLREWVLSCVEEYPEGSAEEIRKYLSYANKTEYALEEIEFILSDISFK